MTANTTIPAFNFSSTQDPLALTTSLLVGQIGFTLLHLGLCQPKNTSSIIINNVFSVCLGAICYWATGYAFAFGKASNAFVSHSGFFLMDATLREMTTWHWHCAMATLFIVIASGGFVDRMKGCVYPVFTILFTGFFFPVASHWSWHIDGWLYNTLENTARTEKIRLVDNGGVSCIHVSAGSVALVAGLFLKPRKQRLKNRGFQCVGGQTNINIFLGGFLAMICLIARNSIINAGNSASSNSLLAAATSSLTAFMFKRSDLFGENWNIKTLISGAITGLVAVSTAPDTYRPYGAFAIGLIAGIVYIGWSVVLRNLRFDDAVDTVAIHLGGGIWGLMAGAFFNKSTGTFYTGTADSFRLFGWYLVAVVVYFTWHGIATFIVLLPFHLANALRYSSQQVNDKGIDTVIYGEPAYPSRETHSGSKKKKQKTLPIWSTIQRPPDVFTTASEDHRMSYVNYPYHSEMQDKTSQNNNIELATWAP